VVETDTWGESSAARIRAIDRAQSIWPRRASRGWRYALLRRMLAIADLMAGLLASLALTTVGNGPSGQLAWALLWAPVWVVSAKLLGLYDRDERSLRHLTVDEIPLVVLWALIGTSLLSLFLEITPAGRPEASGAVLAGAVATLAALVLRSLMRLIWRRVTPPEPIAVIGPSVSADAVRRKLELFPDLHMRIVETRDTLGRRGSDDRWLQRIERIVYAPDGMDEAEVREVVDLSRETGLLLSVVPPFRGLFGLAIEVNHVADLSILAYRRGDFSRSTLFLKRMFDVVASAVGLVILLPFFVLIGMAIKLDSRGPVVFSQVRAGLHGRPFAMRKFRSMVDDAEELLQDIVPLAELDEPMFKLQNDPRVTRVGRVLRRWSIDELPQLWNVFLGQMSLVGPRPEQIELVARYAPEHRFRLALRPGLTGPMQVFGRGELTFEERLAVERDYIEHLSIIGDVQIVVMTIACVFHGRGAY
jgi:exopolysaccharide biosynthesis polyprenyl glycosylphosphotransferase